MKEAPKQTPEEATKADDRPWGGIIRPEQTPAAFGLGLCDPEKLLTPEECAKLERDVINMRNARISAWADSETIYLD